MTYRLCFQIFPLFFTIIASQFVQANPYVDEIRFGVMKNEVRGWHIHHHHERGYNGNMELLFSTFSGDIWKYLFHPKGHVGLSINNQGATSHLYTGLTWFIHLGNIFVIEPSFGFGANNAKRKRRTQKKQAVGSHVMFRESLSVGYKASKQWMGYLMVDHVSSARLFSPNPGITTFGIRIGYIF